MALIPQEDASFLERLPAICFWIAVLIVVAPVAMILAPYSLINVAKKPIP